MKYIIVLLCVFFVFGGNTAHAQSFDIYQAIKDNDYRTISKNIKSLDIRTIETILKDTDKVKQVPNFKNELFMTIIAYSSDSAVIKYMLSSGADINYAEGKGFTPLMQACSSNTDYVKLFIEEGANVNARTELISGSSALSVCAGKNKELVKLLLDKGAEVNIIGGWGNSPLINAAARNPDIEVIKMLVEAGANLDVKNDEGETAIMRALSRNSNLDIARYLIEAGADVTVKDKYGNTALGYLIHRKVDAPDIVQKLIDGGVDVNAHDLRNPLEYAHVCGLKETEKLIIKAGAKMESGNTPESLKKRGMDCKRYSNFSRLNIFSDPPSDKNVRRYWFW